MAVAVAAAVAARVTVPRLWPGSTIVCIGGGPSLTRVDVDHVRWRAKVIAINNAYQLAPWADVLYACDAEWWSAHKGVPTFPGLKYALESPAAKWGVQVLKREWGPGLSRDPGTLNTGMSSGYQSIVLATHLGASRIVLLGYDMQRGPKGEHHWHPDHGFGKRLPYESARQRFANLVGPLTAAGVTVVNCSRETAIAAFPRKPLREVLA